MTDKLQAKVKAVNRANEYAMKLYVQMAKVLTPLVGQQICKAVGLLVKVAKLLPTLPTTTHEMFVCQHLTNHSLGWTVRTTEIVKTNDHYDTSIYHEVTVYVGELQNGVLEKLSSPFTARTDYTAQEIREKRETYAVAKKIADAAQSALYPFGEYDR